MSDRDAFREAREHGLKARHETREARAVRREIGEEIAKSAEEVAGGVLDPEPMFNRGFVAACKVMATLAREIGSRDPRMTADRCTCPDPWCVQHARCVWGHELIICDDDPAFCPACGHDVMPARACGTNPIQETP